MFFFGIDGAVLTSRIPVLQHLVRFTVEERYLIKSLRDSKSYGATRFCKTLDYVIKYGTLMD